MKHLIFSVLLFVTTTGFAQTAHETAFSFMKVGDHDNAILVLNKALQQSPNDEQLLQDIALAYFYKKDFAQARTYIKTLVDRDDAEVVSYQIAGNVYKALEETKEADKMYKKALKKFPASGALYNEYGELLWAQNDEGAIKIWEQGIQMDPSYAGNYYYAANHYFSTKDKVWSLIYGEIFVNMEYLTERAKEIKEQLLKAYKEKLFLDGAATDLSTVSPFTKAVYDVYNKQSSLTAKGINVEALTMIRTRFILDWFSQYGSKYPFKLFDYQQQLLRTGMFEAYNEWLFGPVENLAAFDQWTRTNATAYKNFTTFQKNRVFKIPAGQFYGSKEKQ